MDVDQRAVQVEKHRFEFAPQAIRPEGSWDDAGCFHRASAFARVIISFLQTFSRGNLSSTPPLISTLGFALPAWLAAYLHYGAHFYTAEFSQRNSLGDFESLVEPNIEISSHCSLEDGLMTYTTGGLRTREIDINAVALETRLNGRPAQRETGPDLVTITCDAVYIGGSPAAADAARQGVASAGPVRDKIEEGAGLRCSPGTNLLVRSKARVLSA